MGILPLLLLPIVQISNRPVIPISYKRAAAAAVLLHFLLPSFDPPPISLPALITQYKELSHLKPRIHNRSHISLLEPASDTINNKQSLGKWENYYTSCVVAEKEDRILLWLVLTRLLISSRSKM